MNTENNNKSSFTRINQYIRTPQVRVVLEDGSSPGVMPTYKALQMAREMNLDLVEINPKASPPITKIMDYGKFKYQVKKNETKAKKNQKVQEFKEIQLTPNIDKHDLEHKLNQAKEFLQDNCVVKISCRFRGREIAHSDLGREKIMFFIETLKPFASGTSNVQLEGKNMSVVINPK